MHFSSMTLLKASLLLLLALSVLSCGNSCTLCDSTGATCLACASSTLYRINDGTCMQIITPLPNCAYYTSSGTCIQCEPTYKLNSSSCVKDTSGCIRYSPDYTQCLECGFGLVLSNSVCTGVVNCVTYGPPNNTTCTTCAPGYMSFSTACYLSNGCGNTAANSACIQCNSGYYLSGFNCVPVSLVQPSGCSVVNIDGSCQYCFNGATAKNGGCNGISGAASTVAAVQQVSTVTTVTTSTVVGANPAPTNSGGNSQMPANCRFVDQSTGTCSSCQYNYYLSATNCLPVSPLCKGYNLMNGACLDCVTGYSLKTDGTCSQATAQVQQPSTTAPQQPTVSVPLSNLQTQPQFPPVPQCSQQSPLNGSCVTCQMPFNLANDGYCYDQRCSSGFKGQCGACTQGYYLNQATTCQSIPIQGCTNYTNNQCLACSQGLVLQSNNCVLQQQVLPLTQQTASQPSQTDPYCSQYSTTGQCLACFQSYLLVSGRCTISNQQCASVSSTGACAACYPGYALQMGSCVFSRGDPNCRNFSASGTCTSCSPGYYLQNNICTSFSPLCATSDSNTGACLSCYTGYTLSNGKCSAYVQDANCKQYTNSICTACSSGFYMNNRKCTIISALCATADMNTGACLSCYPGYTLSGNTCSVANRNNGCARTQNGQCISCVSGYYLRQGQCYQVSPLCASYDSSSGFCLGCYQGYSLQSGNCVVSANSVNCKTLQNGVCRECFQGFILQNGNCVVNNPLCKTSDPSSGACLSCYQGYSLIGTNCTIPTNNDPNCVQKSTAFCLTCSNGYYLLSGLCTRLTKNCATYDMNTGNCLSCPAGLAAFNGDCVSQAQRNDPNCIQVSPEGNCVSCNPGFYLNVSSGNLTCQLVSQLCYTFNYQTLSCTQCQNGYFLQDGICIYPSMGLDQYCVHYSGSYCDRCSSGYFLQNYVCAQVDINCVSFNINTSRCQVCRIGTPQGANCQ